MQTLLFQFNVPGGSYDDKAGWNHYLAANDIIVQIA